MTTDPNFGPRVDTQVFAGVAGHRRPAPSPADRVRQLLTDVANLNLALQQMARRLSEEQAAHLQTQRALADLEALVPSASRVTRSMRAQRGIDAGEFEDKTVVDDPDAWNDQTPTRDMSKEDGDE